jgi:hypothetical protein
VLATLAIAPAADAVETCSRLYEKPANGDAGPGRAPILYGDSVVGFAMPQLQRVGFRINAQGCRTFRRGIAALKREAREHKLPRFVVFELGTAGDATPAQIRKVLRILGPKRTLGLVTPRLFFGGIDPDAEDYKVAAQRYPDRVVVIPWAEFGEQHPEWFHPDMVHPNDEGVKAFVTFLEAALYA